MCMWHLRGFRTYWNMLGAWEKTRAGVGCWLSCGPCSVTLGNYLTSLSFLFLIYEKRNTKFHFPRGCRASMDTLEEASRGVSRVMSRGVSRVMSRGVSRVGRLL